ncbi:hypothetical protein LC613_28640 [Nostoc sphaeroides CHAB 2801]|uniref:hypothetical protein n=1 Tax=Nostoc sphaeroides TaxID=446679 RepID=UPI000E4AC7C7|nr:hypothetical protein [Nostoc sphaeroides]MCC5631688.1 hypothetical protein [Nostoc sphaeroides CHAB 2801]
MKRLYATEPDLFIITPERLVNFSKDVILPKYFYNQLIFLSQGNFQSASDAANTILNSLIKLVESDILTFKTITGGTVYFIDEATQYIDIDNCYENIDIRNPLDPYLLSLIKLSAILEAKIIFIASTPEIIRKCRYLNFEIANLEELSTSGESWLQPEMLIDIEASISESISQPEALVTQEEITTSELEPTIQVQWRDIRVAVEVNNIEWIDIISR